MIHKMNHIESQPGLNPEILQVISGTRIAWNKTKEEIWPELLTKIDDKKLSTRNSKTVYLKVVRYAAAAVLALFIGVSSAMYFYTKTIKTFSAQQTMVLLPDNSKVTVYAQSNLSYKPWLWVFSRTVKLKGEGLFEVQKGKKFEVVSPKGKTMVLGTQFTVYARNNAYNVTCISGKVKVVEISKLNEAVITGGQKATLKPDGYFEITDNNYAQPGNAEQPETQALDEELKSVLSNPGEAEQTQTMAEEKVVDEKQSATQSRTVATDKATKQKEAAESSAKQNQSDEVVPGKEQTQPAVQAISQPSDQQLTGPDKATEQPEGNQQGKDKFRASLTPEQISILENQQMDKDEKRKAFMQSLSPEQRQLLDEQNKERARQNASAKPEPGKNDEVKEQQKVQTRQQMQNNTQNREQQKQQTQQGQERPATSGSSNADKPETGKRN